MRRRDRNLVTVMGVAGVLLGACGDDDGDSVTGASTTTRAAVTSTVTTLPPTTATSAPVDLGQPAIWPAAGVVFDSPEAVAGDFVTSVFGVPSTLGDFRQGDGLSGEIDVLFAGEGDAATPIVRSTLLLRRGGPEEGWFVIGAVNDNAMITAPEAGAEVPAGPLSVEGRARGFESTVIVTAFRAGNADTPLDEVLAQGSGLETPLPVTATLDLSAAGDGGGAVVALLIRGGTGADADPGEFGAIPVFIRR